MVTSTRQKCRVLFLCVLMGGGEQDEIYNIG